VLGELRRGGIEQARLARERKSHTTAVALALELEPPKQPAGSALTSDDEAKDPVADDDAHEYDGRRDTPAERVARRAAIDKLYGPRSLPPRAAPLRAHVARISSENYAAPLGEQLSVLAARVWFEV
jgi:hypothetical protein